MSLIPRSEIADTRKYSTLINALKALISNLRFEDSYLEFVNILKKELQISKVGLLNFNVHLGNFEPVSNMPTDFKKTEFRRIFDRVSESIVEFLTDDQSIPSSNNYLLKYQHNNVDYSLYLLPLFLRDELTGMLVLSKKYLSEDTYLDDQLFLSALADQVATFLERQRLQKTIESDRNRMEFLYRISKEISITLDVLEIEKISSTLILESFPSYSACAFLTMIDEEGFHFHIHSRSPMSSNQEMKILEELKENLVVYLDLPMQELLKKVKRESIVDDCSTRRRPDCSATWSCLLSYNNQLTGIFAIFGKKSVEGFMGQEAHRILSTAAMQITAAIQNANLYNRTRRLSITDPITRLYNHRYFLQYLDSELQRFQRYGTPFSLIMADIDHFKMFNDKYGHKVGDDVLYRVAEMLKLGAREIDIVARYGGEEFAIVMPSTGISGARRMAERIRKSLDGKKFTVGKYKLGVTISMGVSEIYPKMSNTELIESADQALYAAKDGGRNCVFYMDRNRCPVKIKTTGKKR